MDFQFLRQPEVSISGADQKDHGLWGRECNDHEKSKCMVFLFLCMQDSSNLMVMGLCSVI